MAFISFLQIYLFIRLVREGDSRWYFALLPFSGLAALLEQLSHQSCPAGLMTGAKATAGFAMEIFVVQNRRGARCHLRRWCTDGRGDISRLRECHILTEIPARPA